jgi:uncharacterized protein RhaS with RHS repeats
MYDPQLGRFLAVDPLADQEGQESWTPYHYVYNDPIKNTDPDGRTPITGAIGLVVGGLIGGGIEVASQLIEHGEVNDWGAVGGATAQGAITGGLAGLTGGTSLLVNAGVAAGANVIGGAVSNKIQGKEVTAGSVAKDAVVGAAGALGGRLIDKAVGAVKLDRAVEKFSKELAAKGESPAMVVAARAPYGKIVTATSSKNPPAQVAGQMKKAADKLGGLGSTGVTAKNKVGCCAEFNAANKIISKSPLVQRSQIQFSKPMQPRTPDKPQQMCKNCETMFNK